MSETKPLVHVACCGHPGHGSALLLDALQARAGVGPRPILLGYPAREVLIDGERAQAAVCDGPVWVKGGAPMLAGVDALLLVVDVRKGPQWQTRDLVETAAALKIPRVIVFIAHHTDADGNDTELLDACELLAREIVDDAGYDANDAPLVRGDPRDPPQALLDAIDRTPPRTRDPQAALSMPAAWLFHRFSPAGRVGPVAAGRIEAGRVKDGDVVNICGTRLHWSEPVLSATVLEVQRWLDRTDGAAAGDVAGLRFGVLRVERSLAVPRVTVPYKQPAPVQRPVHPDRCSVVVASASVPLGHGFSVELTVSNDRRGGRVRAMTSWSRPLFCFGAAALDGLVVVDKPVEPGAKATAQVALRKQLPLLPGTPFALRENGHTVGRGVIVHSLPDGEAPQAWHPMADGAPADVRKKHLQRGRLVNA